MIKATRIYLGYSLTNSLLFSMIFTMYNLYVVTVAHLDPLQLVLLGTALEATVFICEVPTGIVADVYSRRLSIIIGNFIVGAGWLLLGFSTGFWPILASQVLWGLGDTFTSGSTQAWISDELGEEHAAGIFVRGAQYDRAGGLLGIALSVAVGSMGLALPILLGGVGFFGIALALLAWMPEIGFTPRPRQDRTTWQQMIHTFRSGLGMVRRRPALSGILWIGFFFGLYSEGFDRLWVAHLLDRFTLPALGALTLVGWMGIMRGMGALLSIFATVAIRRWVDVARMRSMVVAMLALSGGIILSLAAFALSGEFWLALLTYWTISVLRNVFEPFYTSWVNHRLDSAVRATVISMSSQVDAIGQIASGPVVGVVASLAGIPVALLASCGLLAPVLGLFGIQLKAGEEISNNA